MVVVKLSFQSAFVNQIPTLSEIRSINDPELNSIFEVETTERPPEPQFLDNGYSWKWKTKEILIERDNDFKAFEYVLLRRKKKLQKNNAA